MKHLPVVTSRDVLAALHRAGFVDIASEGGHRQLRRPDGGHRVTVPVHGHQDVPPGTLRSILRQAGLTSEEFARLV